MTYPPFRTHENGVRSLTRQMDADTANPNSWQWKKIAHRLGNELCHKIGKPAYDAWIDANIVDGEAWATSAGKIEKALNVG